MLLSSSSDLFLTFISNFTQGMYHYIPDRKRVSVVCSVVTVLYLQFVLHVMIFSMLNVLHFYISTFRSVCVCVCAVPNMDVFCNSMQSYRAFPVCCSGII